MPSNTRSTVRLPVPTDWHAVLSSARSETRPPGDGWQTTREIAEQIGIKRPTTSKMLKRAKEAGVVEVFEGTIMTPAGLREQVWYRPVLDKPAPRR